MRGLTSLAFLLACLVAFFLIAGMVPARSQPVSTALVLLVDVSGSIDGDEFAEQLEGTARAVTHPQVLDAVASADPPALALALVFFSGQGSQHVAVSWTRIASVAQANDFAARVRGAERRYSDWTAIGDGLLFAADYFEQLPWSCERRIIDVSGDGINNNGTWVGTVRDELVGRGFVINGLPILSEDSTLELYFDQNVVGGPGSFVIPAWAPRDYERALVAKLRREIS